MRTCGGWTYLVEVKGGLLRDIEDDRTVLKGYAQGIRPRDPFLFRTLHCARTVSIQTGKAQGHGHDRKGCVSGRVRLPEHDGLIVLRPSAGQDEPPRWPVRIFVFPFGILGVEVRRSGYGDLFVRGAGSPGGELGGFGDRGRGEVGRVERPGVVDVDGIVKVFCSEIVAYLRRDEDGFGGYRTGL